jgi:hypothetical protein
MTLTSELITFHLLPLMEEFGTQDAYQTFEPEQIPNGALYGFSLYLEEGIAVVMLYSCGEGFITGTISSEKKKRISNWFSSIRFSIGHVKTPFGVSSSECLCRRYASRPGSCGGFFCDEETFCL